MCKKYLTSILFSTSVFLIGCSNGTNADIQSLKTEKEVVKKEAEKLSPEDDPNLKGTSVLGFKMRDSTFESVKKRLNNYKVNGESYAGGPVLENDGSGFDVDGLTFTQFGFDKNQKLVYVGMELTENNHMSHETYKKIVNYVKKNNYKIVREKAPFVGSQETEFVTPNNETILVSAPHMGGFKVNVEYLTHEFSQQRSKINEETQHNKQLSESANF